MRRRISSRLSHVTVGHCRTNNEGLFGRSGFHTGVFESDETVCGRHTSIAAWMAIPRGRHGAAHTPARLGFSGSNASSSSSASSDEPSSLVSGLAHQPEPQQLTLTASEPDIHRQGEVLEVEHMPPSGSVVVRGVVAGVPLRDVLRWRPAIRCDVLSLYYRNILYPYGTV